MKLLALDSSGLVASVAILDGETLVAEYTLNYKKTHSQTLLPMLDEIVKMTQTELSEMDAIAVAAGGGSFLRLRFYQVFFYRASYWFCNSKGTWTGTE